MEKQKDRILRNITDFGSITQLEALRDYGVMRLASRVDELRKDGYPIITERVDGTNRYWEKCHWARYRMGGKV